MRILYVDSNRALFGLLFSLLSHHALSWAEDAATAARLAGEERYDLVITACCQRDGDAVSLARQLPGSPPILVLAFDDECYHRAQRAKLRVLMMPADVGEIVRAAQETGTCRS